MYTEADRAYLAGSYVTLEELCMDRAESAADVRAAIADRRLPQPSYVLPDGTGLFPADYFRLVDDAGGIDGLREHFAARYRAAGGSDPDEDWETYLEGIWGVCLCEVAPETIVRKNALVTSLCELLVLAQPDDPEWRQALREQVDELDALERPFAPDYDRGGRFGRPPTRDLIVTAARERYPEAFAA
jgi:hypothetical protein